VCSTLNRDPSAALTCNITDCHYLQHANAASRPGLATAFQVSVLQKVLKGAGGGSSGRLRTMGAITGSSTRPLPSAWQVGRSFVYSC